MQDNRLPKAGKSPVYELSYHDEKVLCNDEYEVLLKQETNIKQARVELLDVMSWGCECVLCLEEHESDGKQLQGKPDAD